MLWAVAKVELHCVLRVYMLACMQVWGPFRQENYGRHKIIGKVVMACMLGTYGTAAVISLGHLGSDDWAEKASLGQLMFASSLCCWIVLVVLIVKFVDVAAEHVHLHEVAWTWEEAEQSSLGQGITTALLNEILCISTCY